MEIGLIWCLVDGLIAALEYQLHVIDPEVAEATVNKLCRCGDRLRWLLALAPSEQHGSKES